jgi:hypothetical protein
MVRVHRILGTWAVLHSVLLFAILLCLYAGVFSSLWLLWPLVLVLHPGRSLLRVALPIAVALPFLVLCIREYRNSAPVTFGLPLIHYQVRYYDRNGDGAVDFEFHHATNAYDADWGLCDTQFRGRYDLKKGYSPFGREERIDLPVPKHVKITPGEPELWLVR